MKRNIIIWLSLFVVLEGLIVLGAWWMIHQVDSGALATDTPGEAKERIVALCTMFGGGIALLILLLGTMSVLASRRRNTA